MNDEKDIENHNGCPQANSPADDYAHPDIQKWDVSRQEARQESGHGCRPAYHRSQGNADDQKKEVGVNDLLFHVGMLMLVFWLVVPLPILGSLAIAHQYQRGDGSTETTATTVGMYHVLHH